MSTQLNNSGFSTGSNYQFADKMIRPNYPRSLFDDSHLVTRDISQAGLVVPLSVMEALPASDYEINISWLIRMLPQAVPLMSRQRIYFYAFYSRCADLWTGFDSFIRKGYSGNEIKTVPSLDLSSDVGYQAITDGFETPSNPQWSTSSGVVAGSLGDYFGLPLGSKFSSLPDRLPINLMPFMMYLRIWRDYFMNRNYFYSDRALLPDDDADFRLDDSGHVKSINLDTAPDAYHRFDVFFDVEGAFSNGVTSSSPFSVVPSRGMTYDVYSVGAILPDCAFIVGPFYHDYPADYFVSALPWPQRGNTPTLDSAFSFNEYKFKDLLDRTVPLGGSGAVSAYGYKYGLDGLADTHYGVSTWYNNSDYSAAPLHTNAAFNHWLAASLTGNTKLSITLENLRSLAVSQSIMEKMARTDGSYYEFGLTFYGEPSKAAYDYRPTFIGGCTGDIVFTEVLQTSQSSAQSPLGQQAGHGISGNSGYLGRFHSDDYGYIMIMCCIMPDVYYSQGLDKMWSRLDQADWFLPERALLGMQPILNKELFLQDQSVVDDDGNPVNENLWAYQDIFDEYRYQKNRIGGQIADPTKLSFFPFTQSRKFSSLPNWGRNFASSDDIRTDYLASKIESPYIGQFDINIRAVKPLPYRARPASILNSLS